MSEDAPPAHDEDAAEDLSEGEGGTTTGNV